MVDINVFTIFKILDKIETDKRQLIL